MGDHIPLRCLLDEKYVILPMASNGLEMPPDQKAFQAASIWPADFAG